MPGNVASGPVASTTTERGAAAAVAVIAAADLLLPRVRSRAVIALLDEPAHVATTWLIATAVAPGHRAPALAASALLDADHVPSELGSDVLRRGAARPYGHTGLALAAAALLSPGAALGVATHLLRDLAVAPGVSLLWPLRGDVHTLPAPAYYAIVAGAAGTVLRRAALSRAARGARPTGERRPPRPAP